MLARAEIAGGRRVEDRDGAAVEIDGVRHRPGSLLFVDATSELVAWHLDEQFIFWKFGKRSNDWVPLPCPPRIASRVVGAATELRFRPCSGFVHVPLFLDGEIISTPGWHAPTGLILDLPERLPPIPDRPTKNDATAALKRLLRPPAMKDKILSLIVKCAAPSGRGLAGLRALMIDREPLHAPTTARRKPARYGPPHGAARAGGGLLWTRRMIVVQEPARGSRGSDQSPCSPA